jgi:hypothetical protein
MKLSENEVTVERVGQTVESMFGISENDSAHILNILRSKLYSNKILAVIREYCSNAYDAHIEVGKNDVPIKVVLPSEYDSNFRVRDYGPGLSEDDIRNIYVMYGASTKRQSNSVIGQLGIGCKAAFSYTDTFYVTSWFGGEKKVYCAYIDETHKGVISLFSTEKSIEPDGIEVAVPVKSIDFYNFGAESSLLLKYFNPVPSVSGYYTSISPREYDISNTIDDMRYEVKIMKNGYYGSTKIVMGCLPYSVDTKLLDVPGFLYNLDIVIYVPIGSIDIAANRETVEYTPKTIQAMNGYINSVHNDLKPQLTKKVTDQKSFWNAQNEMSSLIRDKICNHDDIIEWTDDDIIYMVDGYLVEPNMISTEQDDGGIELYIGRKGRGGGLNISQTYNPIQYTHNLDIFIVHGTKSNSSWKSKLGRIVANSYSTLGYTIHPNNIVVLRMTGTTDAIKKYIDNRHLDDISRGNIHDITVIKPGVADKHTLSNCKVFRYQPCNGTRTSVCMYKSWSEVEPWEDDDEVKYYIPINRNSVIAPNDYKITRDIMDDIYHLANELDICSDIYGVKVAKTKTKKFQSDKTWIPLFDAFRDKLIKSDILQNISDTNEWNDNYHTIYYKLCHQADRAIWTTYNNSEISSILDSLYKLKTATKNLKVNNTSSLVKLSHILGIKLPPPSASIDNIHEIITTKYPLIDMFSNTPYLPPVNILIRHISDYINMTDERGAA